MAFCNSCGATLTAGTKFCNQCGAAVIAPPPASSPAVATAASVPPASPQPASSSGALKIVLIAVGVVALLGVLAAASLGFFAWHVAHRAHIRHEGGNVKMETPFGTLESTRDPQEAARNLGVDVYPGAHLLQQGASSATFGSVHTTSLNFETPDSVNLVSNFYKAKFPNAMMMSTQADQSTIISNDKKDMVTINIKAGDGKTRVMISRVTHKSDAANSSSD